MIDVLIADDEKLARQNLMILLGDRPDIGQVFEAKDGRQAVEMVNTQQPDLVFLDIEMPGKSGIEVANEIMGQSAIIFVTAYDQYAVDAFKLNAIDYLLKPFDDARFKQSFEKALEHIQKPTNIDLSFFSELYQAMEQDRLSRFKSRIVVKDPGKIRLLPVEDVQCLLGSGNYLEIYMRNGSCFLHRETMANMELKLDPLAFMRVHRSAIVNVSYIQELRHNERGDYRVIMTNGREIPVSRAHKHRLLKLTT